MDTKASTKYTLILAFILFLVSGCGAGGPGDAPPDAGSATEPAEQVLPPDSVATIVTLDRAPPDARQLTEPGPDNDLPAISYRAREIARTSIIIDTHVDLPYRLNENPADVSRRLSDGNFDYPRAIEGGLNAPFMSIYTPAGLEAQGLSKPLAEQMIGMVEELARKHPDKFAIAYSTADVRRHFGEGIISLPMGMENGSPIDGNLSNVQRFHERGIRYITLAHNGSNHISDSSRDVARWDGLSDFGEEVVREMNRVGIMVDVSHISDAAFFDVLELSTVPVIASHSSARHFTPGWARNMSDEMIVAMAAKGGAIMINFGSGFLNQATNVYRYGRRDAYRADLVARGAAASPAAEAAFNVEWAREYGPFPFADVGDVADHIDHVVRLAGVDHVGIGSDFDGVGDSLPVGLKDVSAYPALIEELIDREYSEPDIRKILGENLLRIWSEAEAAAGTHSDDGGERD